MFHFLEEEVCIFGLCILSYHQNTAMLFEKITTPVLSCALLLVLSGLKLNISVTKSPKYVKDWIKNTFTAHSLPLIFVLVSCLD